LEIAAPIMRVLSSATAMPVKAQHTMAASEGNLRILFMALLLASEVVWLTLRARHACGRYRPR
jgi:hypothetical protein